MARRKTTNKTAKTAPASSRPRKPSKALVPAGPEREVQAEVLPPEPPVEEGKVNKAVEEINSLARATVLAGAIEIGKYLLREFFEDDPEQARLQDPTKAASIRKIAEHPDLVVGATTIFNGIRVAVDDRLLGENPAYKQLPWSHRVALLPVKDPKQKAKLAALVAREELKVRDLQAKVRELVEAERSAGENGEVARRGRRPDPVSVKLIRRAQAALKVIPEDFDLKAEAEGFGREQRDQMVQDVTAVIVVFRRLAEALG
jgi:hypothetical protein